MSGFFESLLASPGLLQAWELRSLLHEKQRQVSLLEQDLRSLEEQVRLFEGNTAVIEREIRRSMGYAAADELVFDFTSSERRSGLATEGPATERPATESLTTEPIAPGSLNSPESLGGRIQSPGARLGESSVFQRFFMRVAAPASAQAPQEL